MKCNILISTFSTLDEAKEISHNAIQEKFAACDKRVLRIYENVL